MNFLIFIKQYFFLLFGTLILAACSSMYIPSNSNTPLFEKKSEKQIEAGITTNSISLNGAYAFSNKYAISLFGSISQKNYSDKYDAFDSKFFSTLALSSYLYAQEPVLGEFAHRNAEISIGRYNLLKSKWRVEVFGGLGYGTAIDTFYGLQFKTHYYNGFGQVNLGISKRRFAAGLAMRLSGSSHYFSYQTDSFSQSTQNYTIHNGHKRFTMWHFEPHYFIRFGSDNLKFVARFGFSLGSTFENFKEFELDKGVHNGKINTTILHFSLGLNYCF